SRRCALPILLHRVEGDRAFGIGIDIGDRRQRAAAASIGDGPIVAGTRIENADFKAALHPVPQKKKPRTLAPEGRECEASLPLGEPSRYVAVSLADLPMQSRGIASPRSNGSPGASADGKCAPRSILPCFPLISGAKHGPLD